MARRSWLTKAALQHNSADPASFLYVPPCCMPIPYCQTDLPICVPCLNCSFYSKSEAENMSCTVEATTNEYIEPYSVHVLIITPTQCEVGNQKHYPVASITMSLKCRQCISFAFTNKVMWLAVNFETLLCKIPDKEDICSERGVWVQGSPQKIWKKIHWTSFSPNILQEYWVQKLSPRTLQFKL